MRYLFLITLLIGCYANVHADPIILGGTSAIHYVNGSGRFEDVLNTDLTLHPDIVAQQIFGPGNPNGFVTFLTFLQGPAGSVLHTELIYGGQLIGVEDFILPFDFGPNTALLYGFEFPLSYEARTAILNLSFGGQTASYTFTVREPVPEPATIGLFALGSLAVGYLRKRT